ncbi:hypothetical protein, partial [Actinoplanes sp. NBRC 103695]|uniref:hypothetical protein n=1 Tax=Actinoplanes sp. NBRC 103695 TaxID=3032202 RepID=UPI002552A30D
GSWDADFVGPLQAKVAELSERLEVPHFRLNGRRGEVLDGRSTLESGLGEVLHHGLDHNRGLRVVLAHEANDQAIWLTTQLDGRSLVHLDDSWKEQWVVRGPDGQTDRFVSPDDAVRRAAELADPRADTTMPQLRELLALPTMKDAERYFGEHVDRVRTPEAADELVRLVRQYNEHITRPDRLGDGLIRDSPFFVPDVITPAFSTVVKTAVNAAADPPAESIAPRSQWLADPITAPVLRADENLLFGYLTDRPLNLPSRVGEYLTGLLWLRELVAAQLSTATGLTPRDGLTVIRAKGEMDGERAARTPGQPERLRAHAAITENLIALIHPDQVDDTAANLQSLLTLIECLSGEDRVAWYYVIRHASTSFPHVEKALTDLRNRISDCVQ